MHAIKLMLIIYLTKFYSSKLYVKVICTSYDIPKTESCRKILFPKKEILKEREPVARGAPSGRLLICDAPAPVVTELLERILKPFKEPVGKTTSHGSIISIE
jgi:hypothetical protein